MTGDLHLMTGAYALDSLPAAERETFERHLATCERCRIEVRGLRDAVAEVAVAQAAGPPTVLRDRVLAQVDATAQLPPGPAADPASQAPGPVGIASDAAPSSRELQPGDPALGSTGTSPVRGDVARSSEARVAGDDASDSPVAAGARSNREAHRSGGLAMPRLRRRQAEAPPRRSWRWAATLAGAAAVAALAFGLGNWNAQRSQHSVVATPADEVAQVVTAADARMHSLTMTRAPGSKVIVAPSMGQAVIMAEAMPMPPQGMVYQAWVMDASGAKHGMEPFVPDTAGAVEAMIHGDFAGATRLEVTVEPMGGSDSPSSRPVGVATLT